MRTCLMYAVLQEPFANAFHRLHQSQLGHGIPALNMEGVLSKPQLKIDRNNFTRQEL